MNAIVTYKGDAIVQGEWREAHLMFWNTIIVDETVDFELLLERLRAIYKADRIQFEFYRPTRAISLPPAYKVQRDDVLVSARLDAQP